MTSENYQGTFAAHLQECENLFKLEALCRLVRIHHSHLVASNGGPALYHVHMLLRAINTVAASGTRNLVDRRR